MNRFYTEINPNNLKTFQNYITCEQQITRFLKVNYEKHVALIPKRYYEMKSNWDILTH